jgi:hypothetical protein
LILGFQNLTSSLWAGTARTFETVSRKFRAIFESLFFFGLSSFLISFAERLISLMITETDILILQLLVTISLVWKPSRGVVARHRLPRRIAFLGLLLLMNELGFETMIEYQRHFKLEKKGFYIRSPKRIVELTSLGNVTV